MNPKKAAVNLRGDAIGNNVDQASLNFETIPLLGKQVLGYTNIGAGRKKNQDAASAYLFFREDKPHLVLTVADGLGFYPYSEEAAYLAVTQIPQNLGEGQDLVITCEKIHEELSKRKNKKGESIIEGSTTLVMVLIVGNRATIANIGDSRAYLIRKEKVVYQTGDQTVLELMRAQGLVLDDNPVLLRKHPFRNVLVNALGSPEPFYQAVENGIFVKKRSGLPTIDSLALKKGDFLLLMSDGVYTNLLDEELVRLITKNRWDKVENLFHLSLQEILQTKKTHFDEPANSDNYTFLVYRHEESV